MAESSSSTVDHHLLHSLLEELHDLLGKDKKAAAHDGLRFRMREILHLQRNNGDMQLYTTLMRNVKALQADWGYLKIFAVDIMQWSDADKAVENCGSLIARAQAKADEVASEIYKACQRKKYIIRDGYGSSLSCQHETWSSELFELGLESAGVLYSISEGFSSAKFHSPLRDLSLWIKFAESQSDKFRTKRASSCLKMLTSFVCGVQKCFQPGFTMTNTGDDDQNQMVIEDFFVRLASVFFRAVCLSCFSFFASIDTD